MTFWLKVEMLYHMSYRDLLELRPLNLVQVTNILLACEQAHQGAMVAAQGGKRKESLQLCLWNLNSAKRRQAQM